MNIRLTHEGISIELLLNEQPEKLRDDTWSHPARVHSHTKIAELDRLKTLTLWGEPVLNIQLHNARDNQNGQTIGLILEHKRWKL